MSKRLMQIPPMLPKPNKINKSKEISSENRSKTRISTEDNSEGL